MEFAAPPRRCWKRFWTLDLTEQGRGLQMSLGRVPLKALPGPHPAVHPKLYTAVSSWHTEAEDKTLVGVKSIAFRTMSRPARLKAGPPCT